MELLIIPETTFQPKLFATCIPIKDSHSYISGEFILWKIGLLTCVGARIPRFQNSITKYHTIYIYSTFGYIKDPDSRPITYGAGGAKGGNAELETDVSDPATQRGTNNNPIQSCMLLEKQWHEIRWSRDSHKQMNNAQIYVKIYSVML